MEQIGTWLVGVTCAAVVVAAAESLTPQGTIKKIGRLTGGLVLLLAMLQPLAGWRGLDLGDWLEDYQSRVEGYSGRLEEENQNLMEQIIVEETGAYIVDKAAQLDLVCTVRVTTETGKEGVPIPVSAEIRGPYTAQQREELTRIIADELGIPEERQSYRWEEVT